MFHFHLFLSIHKLAKYDWDHNASPGQLQPGTEAARGAEGAPAPYCLRNKGILVQFSLKFSAINECLGVEKGVHTLAYTTMESSFTFL
jgi:hypothetical protein